jgi:hypothetical protein
MEKDAEFVRPALPRHSRSKSVAASFNEDKGPQEDADPPSPSKRWSPTKSSWLESALSKPDSPKLKQAPPQQPSWMAEINRKRQERGSVDLGKNGPLQSPPADGRVSGRVSPIKDFQLRPVSVRNLETKPGKPVEPLQPSPIEDIQPELVSTNKSESEKEKTAGPLQPPLKPKPALSPKPPVTTKTETEAAAEPIKEEQPPKEENETPKVPEEAPAPGPLKTATSSIHTPVAKQSPLPSPATKAKPETPPKKDFRGGLRPRQGAADVSKKSEVNELQNVFGRLKKAETKKYVAPDTLKDNILRGKSALTVTGGPKPSTRRDELKESLVTKKAAMLAKAEETGSALLKKPDTPAQPPTTPEALAKRKLLGRSDSISKIPPPKEPEPPVLPEAIAKRQHLGRSDSISRPAASKELESSSQTPITPEAIAKRRLLGRSQSISKPSKESEDPTPSEAVTRKPSLDVNKATSPEKGTQSVSSPPLTESARSNKLADRFNPALASLLARGPPAMSTPKTPSNNDSEVPTPRPAQVEKSDPAPELTHMTKGRARGPKRRAPAAKQAATENGEMPQPKVASVATVAPDNARLSLSSRNIPKTDGSSERPPVKGTPSRESLKAKPVTPVKSPELLRKQEKPVSPEIPRKKPSLEFNRRVSAEVKESTPKKSPSPAVPRKKESVELLRRVSAGVKEATPTKSVRPGPVEVDKPSAASTKTPSWRSSRTLPTPPTQQDAAKPTSALQEISAPNGTALPATETDAPGKFSVKNATALWGRQSASSSPVPTRTKSPVKLPTRADEERAIQDAGLVHPQETTEAPQTKPEAPKSKPVGLGLGSLGSLGGLVAARSRESSPPKIGAVKSYPVSPPASDRPKSMPFEALPKPGSTEELLAQFFDEPPVTQGQLPEHIDTIHILKSPPLDLGPGGKIRSLRKQIQEITGDGSLLPIPMQEEHVLYQDSMYLCTHVFGDSKGAKVTEVYLWSGNGVADPTLEDAQLFARNIAKQNQAKLVILRQGKETPNFFEALGGIVITRRGSRPGSRHYMLCGRRHLGHIAFDEVDFSLKGLCSGFAYIISTDSGKVFIWKGRGCSAEELSGARLIGMDLNLNGELVEVDEGSEPTELLSVFPPEVNNAKTATLIGKPTAIPRSAEHWRYKATSEKYRSRLFKMEQRQGSPTGWGQGLQVSSFFAPLLRRPSWQSTAERPQSPGTPKSPLPSSAVKVVEIMPYCQRDLEPEYIYVLDAFFEMYM